MPQCINQTKNAQTGEVTQEIIPWTAESLKAAIAERRWRHEVGGITVGNWYVCTEREERGTLLGMQVNVTLNPALIVNYKPRGGSSIYELNATQVLRICACAAWFVEACFATEKALVEMIDSGAGLETIAAFSDWPQTTFAEEPE